MKIELIQREQTRIIGLKVETLLKDTREHMIIPKLQQTLNNRIKEIRGAVGLPITYGVFIDPPNYNPDTDLFTWIAGVEVSLEAVPNEDMIIYEIPKGIYAVIHYEGDIDHAGSAYEELFEWIQHSDYDQAGTFGFEEYSTIHSALERRKSDFMLHFPVKNK